MLASAVTPAWGEAAAVDYKAAIRLAGTGYGSRYGATGREIRRAIEARKAEASAPRPGEAGFIAHQGQAILLIWILSAAGLIKAHFENANLRNENLDTKELMKQAGEATGYVLGAGEIWSSLIGAGATSAVAAKPLQLFNELLANTVGRNGMTSLLQSGAATNVMFMGWEFFGELYRESASMIENEEDAKRAEMLMPLLFSSLVNGALPGNAEAAHDWVILQQVFANMMEILVWDHDLRNLWLYNTWRNRIATGEFATLVGSMVGATFVGTLIFPGAGTLAGMAFGIAGGVISLYIPKDDKDAITDFFKDLRRAFWASGDDRGGLFNYKHTVLKILSRVIEDGEASPPLLLFNPNARAGDGIASITIEKLYAYESRLQITMVKMNTAFDHGNAVEAEELKQKAADIIKQYYIELDALDRVYSSEYEDLEAALAEYPNVRLDSPELAARYPQIKDILAYREKMRRLSGFMSTFTELIRVQMGQAESEYIAPLTRFYLFGFSEDAIYKLLTGTVVADSPASN